MLETSNLKEYFTKDERNAIGNVINRYFRYLKTDMWIEDLWSIGYYAVWYAREHYDESKGRTYYSWCYKCVFSQIYKFANYLYQQKRRGDMKTESFSSLIDKTGCDKNDDNDFEWLKVNDYKNSDFRLQLEEVIPILSKKQRFVLEALLDGYTQADIARELNITSESVRQTKLRMFNKIKNHFDWGV